MSPRRLRGVVAPDDAAADKMAAIGKPAAGDLGCVAINRVVHQQSAEIENASAFAGTAVRMNDIVCGKAGTPRHAAAICAGSISNDEIFRYFPVASEKPAALIIRRLIVGNPVADDLSKGGADTASLRCCVVAYDTIFFNNAIAVEKSAALPQQTSGSVVFNNIEGDVAAAAVKSAAAAFVHHNNIFCDFVIFDSPIAKVEPASELLGVVLINCVVLNQAAAFGDTAAPECVIFGNDVISDGGAGSFAANTAAGAEG